MAGSLQSFLTPEELAGLGRLYLTSRYSVEGSAGGLHRSRRKGVNVEFADYRPYVPGDDLRQLDWKVYARNERLYLRQSEEETSLPITFCVDASASMGYASRQETKYHFACRMAAALSYLALHHQDCPGLSLFRENCDKYLPPRSGWEHLRIFCQMLEEELPAGKTSLSEALHGIAERTGRRGLIVILSDLFEDLAPFGAALAHFRKKGHDVIVYHILDPAELTFPFEQGGLFIDPEQLGEIALQPQEMRDAYLREFDEFRHKAEAICRECAVEYQMVTTDTNLVPFLVHQLSARAR